MAWAARRPRGPNARLAGIYSANRTIENLRSPMPFPPQLYLIGTQKGGTSYLASLIAQHPDVCLAEPKEPQFYTAHWEKGLDWYRGRFANPDAPLLLDASTSYTAAPVPSIDPPEARAQSRLAGVPEKVARIAPDARFVYLLREPVKRTWSSYWHTVRVGEETLPIREALESKTYYLRMGRYYEQLELWYEHFPRDRFLVLLFEDLVADPKTVANRALGFAGLSELDEFVLESGRNRTFTYTPAFARLVRFIKRAGGRSDRIIKAVKPFVPRRLLERVASRVTKKVPELSPQDAEWLRAYFREPNLRLVEELGLDLTPWGEGAVAPRVRAPTA